MIITCYSDPETYVPMKVDLCEFVKKNPDTFFKANIDIDKRYYLPREVVPSSKKTNPKGGADIIVPTNLPAFFNNASCFDRGYTLRANGSRPSNRGGRSSESKGPPTFSIYRLHCKNHFRTGKGSVAKKYKQGESCAPTCNDEKCGFSIAAYFEHATNRFFVRENSGRNFSHNGHSAMPREYSDASLGNIPRSTLDTAMKLIEKNVPSSMINTVLDVMDKNTLSRKSLDHLRSTVLNRKHGRDSKESTGTTLMRLLKEKEGCDFVYMTGSYDQAMKRVRLHKRYRTKVVGTGEATATKPVVTEDGDILCPQEKTQPIKKTSPKKNNGPRVPWANNKKKKSNKGEDIVWVHENVEADVGSDPERYVRAVVEALKIGDDEVLLAVAWTTKEGRLNHMKFPDILGTDVTFGKNNEKRPQLRVIGKNARNKNIPIVDAFLPSMQRYIFRWFFKEALPTLLDKHALSRTQIIMTDQDVHMIEGLSHPLNDLNLYGSASHRLCKWHKVRPVN